MINFNLSYLSKKLIKKIKSIKDKTENNKNEDRILSFLSKILLENRRKNYDTFSSINEAELKVFSQNGEDGIIDFLLTKLNINYPKFVEIGVEDYSEANTRLLYEHSNSTGLIIDNYINFDLAKDKFETWKGNLKILKSYVNSSNINDILRDQNFDEELDLFSIDIDGIDYWVIKSLPNKISKIFIAEYNPIFGSNLEITVPNLDSFDRTKYHFSNLCWGMSIKALINLMKDKGYFFVGANNFRNNAFFISEKFENIFQQLSNELTKINLSKYTNKKFMESRDLRGNLLYLSKKKEELDLIKDCSVEIINFNKTVKIKDIINDI